MKSRGIIIATVGFLLVWAVAAAAQAGEARLTESAWMLVFGILLLAFARVSRRRFFGRKQTN